MSRFLNKVFLILMTFSVLSINVWAAGPTRIEQSNVNKVGVTAYGTNHPDTQFGSYSKASITISLNEPISDSVIYVRLVGISASDAVELSQAIKRAEYVDVWISDEQLARIKTDKSNTVETTQLNIW